MGEGVVSFAGLGLEFWRDLERKKCTCVFHLHLNEYTDMENREREKEMTFKSSIVIRITTESFRRKRAVAPTK